MRFYDFFFFLSSDQYNVVVLFLNSNRLVFRTQLFKFSILVQRVFHFTHQRKTNI